MHDFDGGIASNNGPITGRTIDRQSSNFVRIDYN